jgi:hypothetical protein
MAGDVFEDGENWLCRIFVVEVFDFLFNGAYFLHHVGYGDSAVSSRPNQFDEYFDCFFRPSVWFNVCQFNTSKVTAGVILYAPERISGECCHLSV